MKFLLDMNLSPEWVTVLAKAGHEAVHWGRVGDPAEPDVTISEHARLHDYVIITNDLDFGSILVGDRAAFPSVIQLRLGDLRPSTLRNAVLKTIEVTSSDLEAGALVTVGHNRIRVSRLPIEGANTQ